MRTDTPTNLDADTLAMLRGSLTELLTERSSVPLADRLAALGWSEVLDADAATALRTLFEIKGETGSTADALGPALADRFAVLTGASGVISVDLGEVGGAGVRVTRADGSTGDEAVTSEVWTALETAGRWLTACELVGIGRHVVASAVDYTKDRVQYGKPIGVFQALQHRLASAHALVVGAGHLVAEAGYDGTAWTATVAKCMAGQAAEFACTQAQQCYGAIGFTIEHEFPGYLRRTYALDRQFGDWRSLEHEIGSRLQATGSVPRIGSL
jgi:alkylation response protein AidB-like acyl-CoA dehydrogenase